MSRNDPPIYREFANHFAVIPNEVSEDRELSAEAVALYTYIMGKSPGWKPRMTDVRERYRWGRERQQRAMRELQAAGYVQRLLITDDEGKIVESTYLFFDTPRGKAKLTKPRDKHGSPPPGSIDQKPEVRRRSGFTEDAVWVAKRGNSRKSAT